MSVRQYIGARYVTKLYENSQDPVSTEWEANVNYEPLTLVTYNNGSYISRMEVPGSVGNPAANPTYWAQTGFYNGQIAVLDAKKLDKYTYSQDDWDSTPTSASTNAITSGAVYSGIGAAKAELNTEIAKREVLVLSTGATVVTSLPYTFNNASIDDDMVCIHDELGTPAAQLNDWTVTTAAGSVTVSGNMDVQGTSIKLFLMKSSVS